MTDHKDPFEERLRAALRSGSERADPSGSTDDELLDRIHRGAARRRTRRRAGGLVATAALTSALLVTLPLLAPPPPTDETARGPSPGSRPDQPSVSAGTGRAADRAERRKRGVADLAIPTVKSQHLVAGRVRTGVEVEVADVKVTSVSGANTGEYWVSGYGTCDDDGICTVLGHSGRDGADLEFTTLPVSEHSRQTTVRFSSDGTTGWATDGGGVFRTDSGGRRWTRLRQPDGVRVSELAVWEDEVWAVGSRPTSQETVVLASHSGSQQLVKVQESRALEPADAVALGPRTFGVPRVDPELNFSRTSDGGSRWTDAEIGCQPSDLSAVDDATWVLCDGAHALVRSTDQGSSWLPPETLDSAVYEDPTQIAAIDADTAFVVGSEGGWVVENQVATRANGIDGPYAFADFSTEDVGYLIGIDGHLCRTDDGGYSWERVELP